VYIYIFSKKKRNLILLYNYGILTRNVLHKDIAEKYVAIFKQITSTFLRLVRDHKHSPGSRPHRSWIVNLESRSGHWYISEFFITLSCVGRVDPINNSLFQN